MVDALLGDFLHVDTLDVECTACHAPLTIDADGGLVAANGADEAPTATTPPREARRERPRLMRGSLAWEPWPVQAIYLALAITSTKGAAPRIASLGAELVDPHGLLAPSCCAPFHSVVALNEALPIDPATLRGLCFDGAESFGTVGRRFVTWLQAGLGTTPCRWW